MRLVIRDVSFSYGSFPVLKGVALDLEGGETASIIGPNGSGKSTLLRCMARTLKPRKGLIYIDGREIAEMSPAELSVRLGYLPQNTVESFPLTVLEVVLMGRKPHLKWGVTRRDLEVVSRVLQYMKIEEMASRRVDELSGGERQKVFIARAMAQEPEILLLDEPTSSLDIRHQLEVLELVTNLAREYGQTVIMVMHDLNLAARFSDKLILLKDGQIFSAGKPRKVITADNIEKVYGVEALVTSEMSGPYVFPVRPVGERRAERFGGDVATGEIG